MYARARVTVRRSLNSLANRRSGEGRIVGSARWKGKGSTTAATAAIDSPARFPVGRQVFSSDKRASRYAVARRFQGPPFIPGTILGIVRSLARSRNPGRRRAAGSPLSTLRGDTSAAQTSSAGCQSSCANRAGKKTGLYSVPLTDYRARRSDGSFVAERSVR